MNISRRRPVAFVVLSLLCAACGSGESQTPAPAEVPADPEPVAKPKPKPTPPAESPNAVSLELSGAVTAKLEGKAGRCQEMKGAVQGASWQVRSDELGVEPPFDLTILVTTEKEWDSPAVILNVRGESRTSYGRNLHTGSPDDRIELARDLSSAEIDVTLKDVVGKGTVRVVGSIRCPG